MPAWPLLGRKTPETRAKLQEDQGMNGQVRSGIGRKPAGEKAQERCLHTAKVVF